MKLSNIRDVLAVAETGSLRAASRKLGITQPTITRSIRDTENELGRALFVRQYHGVHLTEAGRLFVRRATVIHSELRHIYEELEQADGSFTGQVSLAMSAAASIPLLPGVLSKFHRLFPEALLRVTSSLLQPVKADLLSGQIDLFVGPVRDERGHPDLIAEKLFANRRMVVARKGHPLSHVTTLEELSSAHWIRPTFSDRRDEADFEAAFETAGLPPPKIVLQSQSTMMTLLAVENTDLLTILPIQWLESPHGERIRVIPLEKPLSSAAIYIVQRSDVPLTPLAERLSDMIRRAGLNYGRNCAGLR